MLLLHGKSRQKEMNIENTFSELKKKQKNIILLSTPSCQSFSDYLLMTMQWLRLLCETAGTLNIYISYEHLTFCSCNTSKKKLCASFLFLKLMTTNYAHLLAKLNLKDNLSNKLQMQCVSTDLRIVWKRRHQTHLPLIIAFYHLWIIFLHIHQNCRLTSLQIGLNPLMEFAD